MVAQIDGLGQCTEYVYDNLNRQTHERWLDENGQVVNEIVTTYDAADQVTAVSDVHSAYTFTYDALGYQDRVDNTGFGDTPQVVLDYDYDAEGKLESVTEIIEGVEGATTSYKYDERDQVTSITQSGNGTSEKRVEFDYSAIGQFEDIHRYSDVEGTQLVASTDYDYDKHNRLESLTHSNRANESLASYDFTYDEAHRIDTITDVDGTIDYDYDQTNQLISADHNDINRPDESYGYDKNGNRTNSHLHGSDYVTGENNQLDSDGIYTYTYDDQGNMKTQSAIATSIVEEFEWDYRNRLTAIITRDASGTITQQVNYVYDVMGRRIAKTVDADGDGANAATTTHFVYDGHNVLMEFESDRTLPSQRYLHGPQVDQVLAQDDGSGQPQWLLADHLGTVHDVIDNSGTILNHITFDSFGNVLNQTDDTFSTRHLFTGREFDSETGLYYYRARYYNSEIGRFISQDPIGFAANDTNLHRYVGNSPLSNTDPSGKKVSVGYRPFPGNGDNEIGLLESLPNAVHTAIILEPDKPCDFETGPYAEYFNGGISNFGQFPASGRLAVLSGFPKPKPDETEDFIWGELGFYANVPGDAPWNMVDLVEVSTPNGKTDTEFIEELIKKAEEYENGQQAPYYGVPSLTVGAYNSNSFVAGVIKEAGGTPPTFTGLRYVTAPGYSRPLPIPFTLRTLPRLIQQNVDDLLHPPRWRW